MKADDRWLFEWNEWWLAGQNQAQTREEDPQEANGWVSFYIYIFLAIDTNFCGIWGKMKSKSKAKKVAKKSKKKWCQFSIVANLIVILFLVYLVSSDYCVLRFDYFIRSSFAWFLSYLWDDLLAVLIAFWRETWGKLTAPDVNRFFRGGEIRLVRAHTWWISLTLLMKSKGRFFPCIATSHYPLPPLLFPPPQRLAVSTSPRTREKCKMFQHLGPWTNSKVIIISWLGECEND